MYVNCNSLYEGDRDERNKMRGPDDKQKRQLFGWYPIYDTLRGICGELQIKALFLKSPCHSGLI